MTTLSVPDMSCGHCKATIEKTIHALDPAAGLSFDMDRRKVDLQSDCPIDAVLGALAEAGYPAKAE